MGDSPRNDWVLRTQSTLDQVFCPFEMASQPSLLSLESFILHQIALVPSSCSSAEFAIQIKGGADETQVGEGLREISQGFSSRTGLLCVES